MGWQGLKEAVHATAASFDRQALIWVEEHAGLGGRIFCARGCSSCCNLTVNATFPEALTLAEGLTQAQRVSLRRHMDLLRELLPETETLKDFLRLHRRQVGFCPFLETGGACGVYPFRPLACRALFSTRNSDWCAVDFSTLHPAEKQAYLSSLDPKVVAFPTHYLASPQGLARELESSALAAMRERFGFSVAGNLPVLVHLACEHGLAEVILKGYEATIQSIEAAGLNRSYLVEVTVRQPFPRG